MAIITRNVDKLSFNGLVFSDRSVCVVKYIKIETDKMTGTIKFLPVKIVKFAYLYRSTTVTGRLFSGLPHTNTNSIMTIITKATMITTTMITSAPMLETKNNHNNCKLQQP